MPKLLDIVDIKFLRAVPKDHQTENHLIDATRRWRKTGEFGWDGLRQLRENPPSLWVNRDSTESGTFDCVGMEDAAELHNSLTMIYKRSLTVKIGHTMRDGLAKRIVRGIFLHNDVAYNLSLTDRAMLKQFQSEDGGVYELDDVYVCVSVTDKYFRDQRCYKLVAGVIVGEN